MTKNCLYLSIIFAVVLSVSGCAGTSNRIEVSLGQEFSLSIMQSALIKGENLEIKFEEVVEDSRCPWEVTCIWEGRVTLSVEVKVNDVSDDIELSQPGLTDQSVVATHEGYQFTYKVEPYPEAEKTISEDEYRLLLVVNK
jgi:hypothetical protein